MRPRRCGRFSVGDGVAGTACAVDEAGLGPRGTVTVEVWFVLSSGDVARCERVRSRAGRRAIGGRLEERDGRSLVFVAQWAFGGVWQRAVLLAPTTELDAPVLAMYPTIELAALEGNCRAPTMLRVEDAGELRREEVSEVFLLGRFFQLFAI